MSPTPAQLLNLSTFQSWYPGQEESFYRIMEWLSLPPHRFFCASLPTGSGKSLLAILAAVLSGKRTVILTATKGLQAQLQKDFSSLGIVDIRGQNSYLCLLTQGKVDEGPCHAGVQCRFRESGCPYYDRLKEAKAAPIVTTNYAYYLAQTDYADGLGEVGLLVLDEAHHAFTALESHMACTIERMEVERLGLTFPSGFSEWREWREWAGKCLPIVFRGIEDQRLRLYGDDGDDRDSSTFREYRKAISLQARLKRVASSDGRWTWERINSRWHFTPVWPGESYARTHLFQKAPKVLVMSAVLSPKMVEVLGVKEEEHEFWEQPSYFPSSSTPIIHVPTVRLNHKAPPEDLKLWAARIDQIIDRRLDRKGIVFTVSYGRRTTLMEHSQHPSLLFSHNTNDVVQVVNQFRNSPAPAVLVSPTVTTGWDFPGSQCEYIVVGKLPYPDSRSPVIKERMKDDSDWTSYLAMQTLIQEAGRGSRSMDDTCEVLVVDDNWVWFWARYYTFAPRWFRDRVVGTSRSPPQPLPKGLTYLSSYDTLQQEQD